MNLPAGIAAEAALTRQNVALSVIKQNAEQGEQIAQLLDETIRSAPVNSSRGSNVNIAV